MENAVITAVKRKLVYFIYNSCIVVVKMVWLIVEVIIVAVALPWA